MCSSRARPRQRGPCIRAVQVMLCLQPAQAQAKQAGARLWCIVCGGACQAACPAAQSRLVLLLLPPTCCLDCIHQLVHVRGGCSKVGVARQFRLNRRARPSQQHHDTTPGGHAPTSSIKTRHAGEQACMPQPAASRHNTRRAGVHAAASSTKAAHDPVSLSKAQHRPTPAHAAHPKQPSVAAVCLTNAKVAEALPKVVAVHAVVVGLHGFGRMNVQAYKVDWVKQRRAPAGEGEVHSGARSIDRHTFMSTTFTNSTGHLL